MLPKSRRFKEITAGTLCLVSAARGWYDLDKGAPAGMEIATMAAVWALAYGWLTGRWLPLRPGGKRPAAVQESAGQTARASSRRDTPLESVMGWGLWALFLVLVLWLASGAWLS